MMNQYAEGESIEFEEIREKLSQAFIEGYNHPQAQDLGFYVAQAVRDVPQLLRILAEYEQHSNQEILDAIHAVVANHLALSEANRILTSVPSE